MPLMPLEYSLQLRDTIMLGGVFLALLHCRLHRILFSFCAFDLPAQFVNHVAQEITHFHFLLLFWIQLGCGR